MFQRFGNINKNLSLKKMLNLNIFPEHFRLGAYVKRDFYYPNTIILGVDIETELK